jgi:hypothetical protein
MKQGMENCWFTKGRYTGGQTMEKKIYEVKIHRVKAK